MPSGALPSPVGIILLHADESRVTRLTIGADTGPTPSAPSPLIAEAIAQLRAYFAGRLRCFDLPLAPARTVRGEALRAAIVGVPAGMVLGYGALAARCGSSARAIGQACARNPLPILVPCHRIVAISGGIDAYSAGGGVATKRWLLDHERERMHHG